MTATATATTTATTTTPKTGGSHAARRLPTLLDAIWWEVRKLRAQARARYTLLAVLLAPVLIVVVIQGQQRPPKDTLFGRFAHDSECSVALRVLGFAAQWVLPLLTTMVAGDIFASEDQLGTWKTVLTRSVSRRQLFWAKTPTALGFTTMLLVLGTVTIGRRAATGPGRRGPPGPAGRGAASELQAHGSRTARTPMDRGGSPGERLLRTSELLSC